MFPQQISPDECAVQIHDERDLAGWRRVWRWRHGFELAVERALEQGFFAFAVI
jgi:hypothetical protein